MYFRFKICFVKKKILSCLPHLQYYCREIDYNNLTYIFKGLTYPISFAKYRGPMYAYNQLKNGEQILQQVEKQQKILKKN